MTLELFIQWLKSHNAYPSGYEEFWKRQFQMLKNREWGPQLHDSTLVFSSWYESEHLSDLEHKLRKLVTDPSFEDLIDKIEEKCAWGTDKTKLLKALYALSDNYDRDCHPEPEGDVDHHFAEDTLTMSKLG